MITDSDIEWCRRVMLRYGMFSENDVDAIVEVARQAAIQTVVDPNRNHLFDAAAYIISLSNVGYSGNALTDEIQKAVTSIKRQEVAEV